MPPIGNLGGIRQCLGNGVPIFTRAVAGYDFNDVTSGYILKVATSMISREDAGNPVENFVLA